MICIRSVFNHLTSDQGDEEFSEDEGIYDELNLDEEDLKFNFPPDEGDTSDSEETSEGKEPPDRYA